MTLPRTLRRREKRRRAKARAAEWAARPRHSLESSAIITREALDLLARNLTLSRLINQGGGR